MPDLNLKYFIKKKKNREEKENPKPLRSELNPLVLHTTNPSIKSCIS